MTSEGVGVLTRSSVRKHFGDDVGVVVVLVWRCSDFSTNQMYWSCSSESHNWQTLGPRVFSEIQWLRQPMRIAGWEPSPPSLPRGQDEKGKPHEHPRINQHGTLLFSLQANGVATSFWLGSLRSTPCAAYPPSSFELGPFGRRSWRFQREAHERREVLERRTGWQAEWEAEKTEHVHTFLSICKELVWCELRRKHFAEAISFVFCPTVERNIVLHRRTVE